jgi:hypothetical protein
MTMAWSTWHLLEGAGRNRLIPTSAGLYRIRRVGANQLDHVGQTGRSLRARLGQLNGVFGDVMPYNDPHTAGPGLWALREELGSEFESSVAAFDGDVASRKGQECLEISRHRIRHGCSPTMNFGRMPDGWSKSSGNNAGLVARGRRFRGRRDPSAVRVPDAPPPSTLNDDPCGLSWLGLGWTSAERESPGRGSVGVYRARRPSQPALVYVGQGKVADRIRNHISKGTDAAHRQSDFFDDDVAWNWVDLAGTHRTHLLEIENDLIASHVETLGQPPVAQFLG